MSGGGPSLPDINKIALEGVADVQQTEDRRGDPLWKGSLLIIVFVSVAACEKRRNLFPLSL